MSDTQVVETRNSKRGNACRNLTAINHDYNDTQIFLMSYSKTICDSLSGLHCLYQMEDSCPLSLPSPVSRASARTAS
nr:MAG TPA: hypothetical protein [Caudoviricetes sp.]